MLNFHLGANERVVLAKPVGPIDAVCGDGPGGIVASVEIGAAAQSVPPASVVQLRAVV